MVGLERDEDAETITVEVEHSKRKAVFIDDPNKRFT